MGIAASSGAAIISGLALAVAFGGSAAAQAPRQLYNKTIAFSFTADSVQRDPGGRVHNVSSAINYTFYISSAGRIFERSSRSPRGGKSGGGEFGPDSRAVTNIGETHSVHFEGNRLVSLRAFVTGASRMVVSFDPSFTSCTVSVENGKENGVIKRKGTDGIVRELLSVTTTGETCSVREGNPFAS
jgi:hypothetical protein